MKDENLIHVKLEYEEALQSKKETLSSEMNLIKILKKIRQYRLLRIKELKLKTQLHTRLKEMNSSINSIRTILPKIKIPNILKREKPLEQKRMKKTEKAYSSDLESELKDIQRKLNVLQK